jgi:DNA polymerase-3 subunit delta
MNKMEILDWIAKYCKSCNIVADKTVCEMIAKKTDGNLFATKQEIEKLSIINDGKKITLDDILSSVDNEANHNIFDLIDNILLGDVQNVLVILNELYAEDTEPIMILFFIIKELRMLIFMSHDQAKTKTNQYYINKRAPLIKAALSRCSLLQLIKMLKWANKIDRIIKGVSFGDTWRELSALVICFSGFNNFEYVY